MQLGSIVFTVLATAATLIHAVPVPIEGSDLDYCLKIFKNIDTRMEPGEAGLPENVPTTCTDYWYKYQAAVECTRGYKFDQETKIGTVLKEYKSCFEEAFPEHKTQGSKISERDAAPIELFLTIIITIE